MDDYFKKYSNGYYDVTTTISKPEHWVGKTADLIAKEMNRVIPVEKLPERRKWRDDRLIALSQLKKKLDG